MPMYQDLLNNIFENFNDVEAVDCFNPRTETLIFLQQFARAYHIEPKLPAPLSAIILN
jgi:hypothetical protein